jgi:hypothetical protein
MWALLGVRCHGRFLERNWKESCDGCEAVRIAHFCLTLIQL